MSRAQKDRCHECRTEYPETDEGNVKQVRVWVDKGKAWAQTTLANDYQFGTGVPQSYEEASLATRTIEVGVIPSLAFITRVFTTCTDFSTGTLFAGDV